MISLGCIGFLPMIENLLFTAWTYSIYLTLYEWLLLVYFVALPLIMWENYKHESTTHMYKDLTQFEMLGWLTMAVYYIFIIIYLLPAYIKFRSRGGIKGKGQGKTTLIEDPEAAKKKKDILEDL